MTESVGLNLADFDGQFVNESDLENEQYETAMAMDTDDLSNEASQEQSNEFSQDEEHGDLNKSNVDTIGQIDAVYFAANEDVEGIGDVVSELISVNLLDFYGQFVNENDLKKELSETGMDIDTNDLSSEVSQEQSNHISQDVEHE